MARARRRRPTTPAGRARRFSDNRLESPTLEPVNWGTPPKQVRFPSAEQLRAMDNKQLAKELERWGVVDAWPQMRASAAGYLQRMTSLQPGSDTWNAELDKLVNKDSRRFLLGANRRVMREYGVLNSLDGRDAETAEFVRVSEGDEHVCDGCDPLAGMIGTMKEHAEAGLPGPRSCLGGDNCRCELVLVE